MEPSLVEWFECFSNLQEVSSHGRGQFSSSFNGVWVFRGRFSGCRLYGREKIARVLWKRE